MEPNINSSGMMNGLPPVPKENKKIGPIIGVLVIVLIIIVGALVFFGKKLNTTPTTDTSQNPIENTSGTIENINETIPPTEDSSAAIEADLDAQLQDIDYSF